MATIKSFECELFSRSYSLFFHYTLTISHDDGDNEKHTHTHKQASKKEKIESKFFFFFFAAYKFWIIPFNYLCTLHSFLLESLSILFI